MMVLIASILSGLCFLASESLLFKALDFSIGSSGIHLFLTVGVFIFASSLGTFAALKFKKVWLAEFLLSFLCLIAAIGFPFAPQLLNVELKESLILTQNLITILITFPFAFLYGFSFPALASYSKKPVLIYFYQALGGVLGLVFFEFFFFPNFGILHSFLILAILHLITSGILYTLTFSSEKISSLKFSISGFLGGTFNGIIQASLLFLAKLLIQPLFFVSTLVVLIMILGLTKASLLPWYRINYLKTLLFSLIYLFLGINISLWFNLHELSSLFKGILLIALFFPLAVSIGGLFPFLIHDKKDKGSIVGLSLSISLGNLLGLIFFGMISAVLPLNQIWAIALIFLAFTNYKNPSFSLSLMGIVALFFSWHIKEDKIIKLTSPSRNNFQVEKIFRSFNEISAVYSHEDIADKTTKRLYQNGFSPINLDYSKENLIVDVSEKLLQKKENCLVLGVGSGKSAGTCSQHFNFTSAIDIGLTVPSLVTYLKEENFNLINNPKVKYQTLDALLVPYLDKKLYDLIVLTTDPANLALATKLYSSEYFALLSKNLDQKGIFVFWLDAELNSFSQKIIINSAKKSFKYQKKYTISKDHGVSSYYLVLNSQEPIVGEHLEEFTFEDTLENHLWNPHKSLLFNKKGKGYGR